MSYETYYISSPDEESSEISETSFLEYNESEEDNNATLLFNYNYTTMYLVFIFNRRKVVWHQANSDYTIADIFEYLEKVFQIKKCMLDIEQHTFFKPNNLLLQPLLRNHAGCDIHVSMKDRLVDRCVQNNTHLGQSNELV